MRLIQFLEESGQPRVGWVTADGAAVGSVGSFESTYELAQAALSAAEPLDAFASKQVRRPRRLPYAALLEERRVLRATHASGPGALPRVWHRAHALRQRLDARQMHKKLAAETLSDSMQMFKWGVEGGRPATGDGPGAQPEWFYKGDGDCVVACGQALPSPSFALDGGEEPEIVGLYVIATDGTPQRLGFAIGNEFSDHVTERKNYLYLAHSKLRPCAIGPELRTGAPPAHMEGASRIRRGGQVVWERPFVTGEANMCHSLANLEYHHFKYRRTGARVTCTCISSARPR